MNLYDYCIFLVGAPEYLFESSVSSILRTCEIFNPKEIIIYYSRFAKHKIERIEQYVKEFVINSQINLQEVPRLKLKQFFEEEFSKFRNGTALLVPTAGSIASIINAVYVTAKLGKNIDIAHVLFPFRYWTRFYYPFIPRYLQPITLLSKEDKYKELEDKLKNWTPSIKLNLPEDRIYEIISHIPELHREIAYISYMINRKYCKKPMVNDFDIPKLCLKAHRENNILLLELNIDNTKVDELKFEYCKLIDNVKDKLKGFESRFAEYGIKVDTSKLINAIQCHNSHKSLHLCSNEDLSNENILLMIMFYIISIFCEASRRKIKDIGNIPKNIHGLRYLLGFYTVDISSLKCENDGSINLEEESFIIDTNLIYKGFHNYATSLGNRLYIPYCAEVEIMLKLAEAKDLSSKFLTHCVWLALNVLKHYCNYIPTNPEKCDFSIPKVDPDLVKHLYILTCDKSASELWKRLAISKYANVCNVDDSNFRIINTGTFDDMSQLHFSIIQLYAFFKLFYKSLSVVS